MCLVLTLVTGVIDVSAAKKKKNKDDITVVLKNYTDKNGDWQRETVLDFGDDVKPQLIEDRTMLPIRAVMEEMGYDVVWMPAVEDRGTVIIQKSFYARADQTDLAGYYENHNQILKSIELARKLEKKQAVTRFKTKLTEITRGQNVDRILYNSEICTVKAKFVIDYSQAFFELVGHISEEDVNILEGVYELDVAPTIVNGRTLVPLRAAAEVLGLDVQWIGETKTVVITA